MGKDTKKSQWHPAFYGALHLELAENKDDLEFTEEYILNTMPLRVDTIVIKKKRNCIIKNEIGRLFQTYNLIEYKSPNDTLNYDTFLKGIAYTYLYKGRERYVDEIEVSDMSLTFIRQRKPIKLFKQLEYEGFLVEEFRPGIYYISKKYHISIQIVVSSELDNNNHIWLNSLKEHIEREQATKLVHLTNELTELDDKKYADSVWEIVASQNRELVEDMGRDDKMCKAMAEIFKPEIDAAKAEAFDNGFNNGVEETCIRMISAKLKKGKSTEEIADNLEMTVEEVNRLIGIMNATA